ncbi:MAG: carboxypeptidase-like regulatory domain-containing protein [Bacteroidota bacterium]
MNSIRTFLVLVFFVTLNFACQNDSQIVEGKVVNVQNGKSITGVMVQVMGTDLNTKTNKEGVFKINTRKRGEELIFTHKLYEMKRLPIEDEKRMNVELKRKQLKLNRSDIFEDKLKEVEGEKTTSETTAD